MRWRLHARARRRAARRSSPTRLPHRKTLAGRRPCRPRGKARKARRRADARGLRGCDAGSRVLLDEDYALLVCGQGSQADGPASLALQGVGEAIARSHEANRHGRDAGEDASVPSGCARMGNALPFEAPPRPSQPRQSATEARRRAREGTRGTSGGSPSASEGRQGTSEAHEGAGEALVRGRLGSALPIEAPRRASQAPRSAIEARQGASEGIRGTSKGSPGASEGRQGPSEAREGASEALARGSERASNRSAPPRNRSASERERRARRSGASEVGASGRRALSRTCEARERTSVARAAAARQWASDRGALRGPATYCANDVAAIHFRS